MPVTGTARYEGAAFGLYGSVDGGDVAVRTRRSIGTTEFGSFGGDATLLADFGTSSISGCVGCQRGILYDGTRVDPVTGTSEDIEYTFPGRLSFGSVSFGADGKFKGSDVRFEATAASYPYSITSSSGVWGGQFSNVPDAEGDPRSVSGVFSFGAETAGGSTTHHIGAYLGAKRD